MEFRILGPLEVLDGEQSVPLRGAKPRALLGVLLLHANEVVSNARLVDELWGERPPATAEKLVQGYVHALRKLLGAEALVTQAPGYRLRLDPRALDLLEFQRLVAEARTAELEEAVELRRRALALWHGPPLADVSFETGCCAWSLRWRPHSTHSTDTSSSTGTSSRSTSCSARTAPLR